MDFDPAFLPGDGASMLDLSRYAHGNPVLPGAYEVDIWMNGDWQERKLVRFEAHSGGADATPCITHDELVSFGMAPDAAHVAGEDSCAPIGRRFTAASTHFDVSEQRLDIEVPQASMERRRRGLVPRAQWDPGVTAGLLAWRTNLRHVSTANRRGMSVFVGADAGFNWNAWRVRHAGAWSGGHYRRRHSYAERQWDALGAQLRIGDMALADDLFAPLRLRGLSVSSDARMAADALNGYAPRVKGVAATHATVRVRQNGVLLRELVVPPGPFVLDDLYAAGRGGDLEVDIEERDGGRRSFRIPFFPVPELLREGHTAYALSAGRAIGGQGISPGMFQASWRHGFPRDTTAYAGWRQQTGLTSLLVGGAVDTLAGAFSADLTHSQWRDLGSDRLWRARHGRQWRDGTLVSFGVSGGRDGAARPRARRTTIRPAAMRRVDLLVQRDLGEGSGALSVSASRSWGRDDSTLDQAASWTRGWGRATLDISLRRSRRQGALRAHGDLSGQLGFSMPLGASVSSLTLQASVLAERAGGGTRAGVSGNAGEDGATLYGVTLGRQGDEGPRLDGSISRVFAMGEVAATVDRSATAHGASLSASGGIVVHSGGVTFAQRLGESSAVVKAPGAEGARLGASPGIRVDRRGFAVVPYLTPFRWNAVDLDPTGVSLDVAFVSTHRRVAPTSGAVLLVSFDTQVATTRLVTASLADGTPLPFGTEVVDSMDRSVGVVGQAGRVFLRAEGSNGGWIARWSEGAPRQCELRLTESSKTAAGDMRHTGVCE